MSVPLDALACWGAGVLGCWRLQLTPVVGLASAAAVRVGDAGGGAVEVVAVSQAGLDGAGAATVDGLLLGHPTQGVAGVALYDGGAGRRGGTDAGGEFLQPSSSIVGGRDGVAGRGLALGLRTKRPAASYDRSIRTCLTQYKSCSNTESPRAV